LGFGPGGGKKVGDLAVGHRWQAGEGVAQVGEGVDGVATAAFDDGVKHCRPLASLAVADEEPVFLANGGGADGVFDRVVVDLHAPVLKIYGQARPLFLGAKGVNPQKCNLFLIVRFFP
jgi:hypothetical protein